LTWHDTILLSSMICSLEQCAFCNLFSDLTKQSSHCKKEKDVVSSKNCFCPSNRFQNRIMTMKGL